MSAAPGRPKQANAPLGGSEETSVPSVGAMSAAPGRDLRHLARSPYEAEGVIRERLCGANPVLRCAPYGLHRYGLRIGTMEHRT